MPPANWDAFAQLPGSAESNFEQLCRALIRRHYGRYGDFAALAAQPGVEFHLKLHTLCSLGEPGRWYGWQCRWYDLPGGRALGSARRQKIKKAITTTEKVLPDLTDWVLWTRRPLTKGDQNWLKGLRTHMRLHQWTAAEVEEHLSGDAAILRGTYFGELVLTPANLADLHQESVAPIRRRWQPEAHQIVNAERSIRQMLGDINSWSHFNKLGHQLKSDAAAVSADSIDLAEPFAAAVKEIVEVTRAFSAALADTHSAVILGDLDLLKHELGKRPDVLGPELRILPRKLRAIRHRAALTVTNAIANVRLALKYLDQLKRFLESRLIAVLADAGCGKTQLAAQLTAAEGDRPSGILLHGRDLHAGHGLDDMAHKVVISGIPVPSIEALVAAVDAAGQRAHRRLAIVIDGLNEAEDPRDWKPLLAPLGQVLLRYSHVLVVCTIRSEFADEALPQDVTRLEMPDFGHDTIDAIRRYFTYYRIKATDAELPIELLRHPLTLRLFCEVTNPTRQREVGIEAMPGSLTALFDRYLQQATERIAELSPRTRRYYDHDVRAAFHKVGTTLWEAKTRTLDMATLRSHLGDEARPWNESIVRALEQEGVLLRVRATSSHGTRLAVVFDALAGHLIANSILTERGQIGMDTWLKDPITTAALTGSTPDKHPLARDTFLALAGLMPRRLNNKQLWTLLDPLSRVVALRAAAELEGTYLDAETVQALSALVLEKSAGTRDLFDRLWQTRGAPEHALNADFLDAVLRPMSLAERDIRWTEWLREHQEGLIDDLLWIEKRWKRDLTPRSRSERLRARWIMWTLSSTVLDIRDQATRALYWFGRRDPAGLFDLTINALGVNDPYVSERMLAAAYGVCMALHCRPKRPVFRAKLLPAFAKRVYQAMFANSATHSTTHVLARDFGRRIIDVALLHAPSLLGNAERIRVVPPYKDGGLRQWEVMEDPNEGKYREGNSPLGMDFKNYTIGWLVPKRNNYDFNNEEYERVVGQIIWRIYQLGYSLEVFGEVDKHIAGLRYRTSRAERPRIERYGKKYARIAFFEQYGLREDAGLLDRQWGQDPRPSDIDIDPSFPGRPRKIRLTEDILGDRSSDIGTWVQQGPTPEFRPYLVPPKVGRLTGPWILLDGHCSQQDKDAERIGFVMLQSFLLLKDDEQEFIRLMRKESPRGSWLPEAYENHYTFAGEIPWCDTFPRSDLRTVNFVIGSTKVKVSPNDPRYNLRFILNFGGLQKAIGPGAPPEFEQVDVYRKIPVYVPMWRSSFSSTGSIERPSCVVPAKELAELFHLWLSLPTWSMYDQSGKLCSIATGYAGKDSNYEHHLFFRKELIDELLESQNLALVWAVWGERQHFGERHAMTNAPSHGYKQFIQLYRYRGGHPRRIT